jgi:hypothetical protein
MSVDEREAGLLKLIETYRDSERRALLDATRAEARALVARAYREGRARLHERATTERANARARIQAARAERDTRARAGGERANARLLALAWPRLRAELQARWSDPAGRRDWGERAVAEARRLLPAGVWTIRHAPGWDPLEWRALAAELTVALGNAPRLVSDGRLEAGLTVACGGTLLDASLDGLLQDRNRIEARLLALLAQTAQTAQGIQA